MKTIKINFQNFFEGFDKENNLFINILRNNYNVIISDNPDFLFYSIYPEQTIQKDISSKGDFIKRISPTLYILIRKLYSKLNSYKKNNKIDIPEGDFIKILYSNEDKKPNMDECDWAFAPFSQELMNNERYFEIPVSLMTDFSFDEKMELPIKKEIDFEKIKKDKTKFCNFIYSQEIPFRNKFFKSLSKYKHIDAPGRCMTNMEPITCKNARDSRRSNNWALDKLNFLKHYKFTIAFENTNDHPYTTEKLVHPLIVDSIPIYLGNKNVGKYFNTKRFINYNDFVNMEEFIQHIKDVDNDDELWKKYLEQPIFNNSDQQYFNSQKRIKDKLNEIIEGMSK